MSMSAQSSALANSARLPLWLKGCISILGFKLTFCSLPILGDLLFWPELDFFPREKIQRLSAGVASLQINVLSPRRIMSFLGLMTAAIPAVPWARFHQGPLQLSPEQLGSIIAYSRQCGSPSVQGAKDSIVVNVRNVSEVSVEVVQRLTTDTGALGGGGGGSPLWILNTWELIVKLEGVHSYSASSSVFQST